MEKQRIADVLVVGTIVVLGGALVKGSIEHQEPGTVKTNLPPIETASTDIYGQIEAFKAVRDMQFFAPPQETELVADRPNPFYRIGPEFAVSELFPGQEDQQQNALDKAFLNEKGIEVDFAEGAVFRGDYYYDRTATATPYSWAFAQLMAIPQSVVDASGLKKLVIEPSDYSGPNRELKHEDGTLHIPANMPITEGLAGMLIDNHIDNLDEVLQAMRDYTVNCGDTHYDPEYRPDSSDPDWFGKFRQEYGDAFLDADAVRSPRLELIEIMERAIQGGNWYSEADLNTALGKKKQLVQAIFDTIEPAGYEWQIFRGVTGGVGATGHPNVQAAELLREDRQALRRWRDEHWPPVPTPTPEQYRLSQMRLKNFLITPQPLGKLVIKRLPTK